MLILSWLLCCCQLLAKNCLVWNICISWVILYLAFNILESLSFWFTRLRLFFFSIQKKVVVWFLLTFFLHFWGLIDVNSWLCLFLLVIHGCECLISHLCEGVKGWSQYACVCWKNWTDDILCGCVDMFMWVRRNCKQIQG